MSASLELGGKNPWWSCLQLTLKMLSREPIGPVSELVVKGALVLETRIIHEDVYDEFMSKFMDKVSTTQIGDSMRHEGVLYGSMLSEKYGEDFLKGLDMCENDGAVEIMGDLAV